MSSMKLFVTIGLLILTTVTIGCAPTQPKEEVRYLFPPPPETPRYEWVGTYSSTKDFEKTKGERMITNVLGDASSVTFTGPISVAVNIDGTILVSDLYDKSIKVLDLEGRDIHFYKNPNSFDRNLGIATDSQGLVYVAGGAETGQVLVYDLEGRPVRAIGNKEVLQKPSFLAINETLGRLYVSDPHAHDVKIFTLSGEFIKSFGGPGTEPGQFNAPQGMAVNAEGLVYVADMLNARFQVFTPDGEFVKAFGQRGISNADFEAPKDIAFDSEGHMYIVDARRPYLRIYENEESLLLILGGEERTGHKMGFSVPTSVYVDAADRVFITDNLNKRVAIWQYLNARYLEKNPL